MLDGKFEIMTSCVYKYMQYFLIALAFHLNGTDIFLYIHTRYSACADDEGDLADDLFLDFCGLSFLRTPANVRKQIMRGIMLLRHVLESQDPVCYKF